MKAAEVVKKANEVVENYLSGYSIVEFLAVKTFSPSEKVRVAKLRIEAAPGEAFVMHLSNAKIFRLEYHLGGKVLKPTPGAYNACMSAFVEIAPILATGTPASKSSSREIHHWERSKDEKI